MRAAIGTRSSSGPLRFAPTLSAVVQPFNTSRVHRALIGRQVIGLSPALSGLVPLSIALPASRGDQATTGLALASGDR